MGNISKWTTSKPTVPGWYWWRCSPYYVDCLLVLHRHQGGFTAKGGYWEDSKIVSDMKGEWAGPLMPPEEG